MGATFAKLFVYNANINLLKQYVGENDILRTGNAQDNPNYTEVITGFERRIAKRQEATNICFLNCSGQEALFAHISDFEHTCIAEAMILRCLLM